MIDLHIHTTSSDGSDEPKDILIKAQQLGLKYISITDHNSIGAYKKLQKIKIDNYFKGEIIPGCEFAAVHNGKPVEILGYGIDLETLDSMGLISDEKFLERENDYLKKLMSVCKSLNLTYDTTLSIKGDRYFATQVMYANLKKYPQNEKHFTKEVWGSVNAFYRICVNHAESPFFLNEIKNYPTIEEIASLIKKAGGKAILAHLYGYFVENYEELLNAIISLNVLDGIECYHSLHSIDKTNHLLNYCKEHALYASGGSDYHGKLKPTVKIGESISGVKIPFEILQPWLSLIHCIA
jgi:predicted metal-dependent phosphoesterase TrpH